MKIQTDGRIVKGEPIDQFIEFVFRFWFRNQKDRVIYLTVR